MSVNPDQDQHRRNRLLSALRPRDYALLEPHLQIVPIGEGEFLHLPGEEIEQVYFLHKGIVSLMAIMPTFAWPACCVAQPAPIFCEPSSRRDAVPARPLPVPEQCLRAEWGTRERFDRRFW